MSQTTLPSLARRASAAAAAIPLPRLRRMLLGLYLLTAFADAGGKALASNHTVNRAAAELVPAATSVKLEAARRPAGNFEIFRAASHHLFGGEDLYVDSPDGHSNGFKYSPTFALLFAPLAAIPWPLALFLWSALNACVLFAAVERLLPPRAALLALGCQYLEVLRAMQNAQSNALVAGLIILAFVALERRRAWRAAAAVALGACVKIFPLAALTFALPQRRALRTGAYAALAGAVLLLLPLLVLSPAALVAQYGSWRIVEASDAHQRWFSVMELVQRWAGGDWPNWPVQLAGTAALLAPLALRRERWTEHRFRLLYLCSVLLYVVLFNHQAERASYVIAFAGAAIWFASEPRTRWRSALFGVAMLALPIMSTLIPGAIFRTPTAVLYRLVGPMLAIWLVLQWELWRRGAWEQVGMPHGRTHVEPSADALSAAG
jgi:hypothetical protein